MLITKTTQGIVNRFKTASRRAVGRSGKLLGGKRWISALALLCALSACGTAAAQTKHEQLTIGKTTNLDSISDDYSSILFTGPYALTLRDGQTLWTVLVSKETGAVLIVLRRPTEDGASYEEILSECEGLMTCR